MPVQMDIMKAPIDFFFNPDISHPDRQTEFRLNTFYRLLSMAQLFLTLPIIVIFALFHWWAMVTAEMMFFCLTAFAQVLTRKGNLSLAVNFFVFIITLGCLVFLTFSTINDATFVISIGIIICGVFLTMKETVLWGAVATASLLLIAFLSPDFTLIPQFTLNADSIAEIHSTRQHFSTSIVLIWSSVFFSIIFHRQFAELLEIITRDNKKLVREVEERKAAETKVRTMNEDLEKIVEERTRKLRMREEQLLQSEKMRAIGQLAGGIAHDFNNQLTGIISCVDLICEDASEGSELRELAETAGTAARRAGKLIEQLLSFARKGKQQTSMVDIHEIVDHVISLLRRSIDKRIVIDRSFRANYPIVKGDPAQFQSVLMNLAMNSRDAMPGGGALVFSTESIALTKSNCPSPALADSPGEYLLVSVSDTGTGIDKDIQARIFEPFFTTKDRGKGIGMGLAAVYGAVESNHGTITVRSGPGEGTVFKIYLPVCRETQAAAPAVKQTTAKRRARVLLVDDEEVVRMSAMKVLNKAGFDAVPCKDGAEALQVYEKEWKKLDIILLDMIMPGIGGKETFRKIREINSDARVIISSGYSFNNEAQTIIDEGARCFIQKPYNIDELVKLIFQVANAQ
ncbi:MAG: response regulator [Chitinivibrionales bacterium]|nr:response regulator [Chitinivibrionales bacterium]